MPRNLVASAYVAFAELKGPVKDRLGRYGLYDAIGPDHFFPTIGTAVDAPARQAFVPGLVPTDAIQSAVALNSILWQGAAVVGPLLAGLVALAV